MPKQKKESRGVRGRASKDREDEDDKIDSDDSLSQISEASGSSRTRSERGTHDDQDDADRGSTDDAAINEQTIESNFREYLDALTEKSANTRTTALQNLAKLLAHRVIGDLVYEQCDTVFDCLQRLISKRNIAPEEQALAARCVALVVIQLGCCDEAETRFREASSALRTALLDDAVSPKARGACGLSLAIGAFVLFSTVTDLEEAMSVLESVFSQSFNKGDGTSPVLEAEVTQLHYSCLLGWSLMLTLLGTSSRLFDKLKERVLPRLAELLASADVQLRICAGETVALFYEIARSRGDEEEGTFEFEDTFFNSVIETVKQLSVDSVKYRSKKDLRAQKRSFRDILRTVEDGDLEEESFHISKRETLTVTSWCMKRQYSCFCSLLGAGMVRHLLTNELLRDMFELGDVLETPEQEKKDKEAARASKRERRQANLAASKARTKQLRDAQDKRRFHLSECGPDS